jgi:anti-anti-sigma factor
MPDSEADASNRVVETRSEHFRCFALFVATDRAAILLQGDIDLVAAPIVYSEVMRHAKSNVSVITVDLAPVTFMDSSGLVSLLHSRIDAAKLGADTRVLALSNAVRIVIDASRVAP